MPLQATSGAASYDGFGGGVPFEPTYIEQVFATHLYTGNGTSQTITNGIDLSGKGGLVWLKQRDGTWGNYVTDTARGAGNSLLTNSTSAQSATDTSRLSAFNTNGFSIGNSATVNGSGSTMASWTFREQPKFFDVVTYTGNGATSRNISHSLGSDPGCIIVKRTSGAGSNWSVYHRSTGTGKRLILNQTSAVLTDADMFASVTSTTFSVSGNTDQNDNGESYVAYLFAHNAGGFGLTGTDNVISCGSFTVDGSGNSSINLGYEPQWLLMKQTNTTGSWLMQDTMRGQTADNGYARLLADTSGAETSTTTGFIRINATGFSTNGAIGLVGDHIYIAIRRGPMKTPTTGTSVFQPTTWTGTGAALQQNVNINYDSFMQWRRNGGYSTPWMDRLRGFGYSLYTQQTSAEVNQTAFIAGTLRNNFVNFVDGTYNLNGEPWLNYAFVRAPGFFDVVCYTGNGVDNSSWTHNLGVTPELIIVKSRSSSYGWPVYNATDGYTYSMYLNTTAARTTSNQAWYAPTSSVFKTTDLLAVNGSGATYVAYLFASCPGVSKVGSYTGTGALQTINCGFTGGARFVLIKRTDSTGDWWVYDSARGITSGNDPYLFLNVAAAEVTGTNYVDTTSVGFQVTAAAPAGLNANGGSYIFLAIA